MRSLFDVLSGWWIQVWPNLAASVIWATPAFIAHHKLIKRRMSRQHEDLKNHITAQSRQE